MPAALRRPKLLTCEGCIDADDIALEASFSLRLLIAIRADFLNSYNWPGACLLRMALIAQRSILLQQIGLLLNLLLKTQS